jgi:hypothetical protein
MNSNLFGLFREKKMNSKQAHMLDLLTQAFLLSKGSPDDIAKAKQLLQIARALWDVQQKEQQNA